MSRGFSQRRRRSRKNLVVATANTTTYTKIPFVEADLLLVQEIKSVAAGIESMKKHVRRESKYTQLMTGPSVTTEKGGTSAGVAICATNRNVLGVPKDVCEFSYSLPESRVVLGMYGGLGKAGVVVGSVYLHTNQDLSGENNEILKALAEAVNM